MRIYGGKNGGGEITSVETWHDFAPPAKPDEHWVDGRSAKELARAWCRPDSVPAPPEEFVEVLSGIVPKRSWKDAAVHAERGVLIDYFSGPPNLDLAIVVPRPRGPVVVGVEAKADEPFGPLVREQREAADRKGAANEPTRLHLRIRHLLAGIVRPEQDCPAGPADDGLRYQLLSGIAGTLRFAEQHGAETAVFTVHEFRTPSTENSKHRLNAEDLLTFLTRLAPDRRGPEVREDGSFVAVGPFTLPRNPRIKFHVAKVVTKLT